MPEQKGLEIVQYVSWQTHEKNITKSENPSNYSKIETTLIQFWQQVPLLSDGLFCFIYNLNDKPYIFIIIIIITVCWTIIIMNFWFKSVKFLCFIKSGKISDEK